MLFSKKQRKNLKLMILSTNAETILLLIYLISFPYIMYSMSSHKADYWVKQGL